MRDIKIDKLIDNSGIEGISIAELKQACPQYSMAQVKNRAKHHRIISSYTKHYGGGNVQWSCIRFVSERNFLRRKLKPYCNTDLLDLFKNYSKEEIMLALEEMSPIE